MLDLTLSVEAAAIFLVVLWVVIAAVAIFAYFSWQRLVLDVARRELFRARDRTFLAFAASELGADHPAHLRVRSYFNSAIRHAHRLTFGQVILAQAFLSERRGAPADGWTGPSECLDLINDVLLRKTVAEQLGAAHSAMLDLMVNRSVIALPLSWMYRVLLMLLRPLGVQWRLKRPYQARAERDVDIIITAAAAQERRERSYLPLKAA